MPKLELPTPLPLPLIACLLYDPQDDGPQASFVGKLVNQLGKHAGRPTRTIGYLGMSLFVYNYTTPPLDRAATFASDWRWPAFILARNLAIMLIFFGGWHHFLYESRFRKKLADKKYNPKDYNPSRDRLWTVCGTTISSCFEIGILHLMATNRIAHYRDFWQFPSWSLFFMILTPYYVEFHFFMVHKLLHYEPLYKVRDESATLFVSCFVSLDFYLAQIAVVPLPAPQELQSRALERFVHASSRASDFLHLVRCLHSLRPYSCPAADASTQRQVLLAPLLSATSATPALPMPLRTNLTDCRSRWLRQASGWKLCPLPSSF